MFDFKENAFQRISQSFDILKNNFWKLFLPMFIYQFVSLVLIGTLVTTLFLGGLVFSSMNSFEFIELFSDPKFIAFISIGTFFILYI